MPQSPHPVMRSFARSASAARLARENGTQVRNLTTLEREGSVRERAAAAAIRDEAAAARDRSAALRDQAAEKHERELGTVPGAAEAIRERAVMDRWHAAADRDRAVRDREQATRDRERALEDLERAHIDDLTGFLHHDMGTLALENEISRARRTDGWLMLALVDVDGLTAINEARGNAAGDAVIRGLASVLRRNLRPYEPIVRIEGGKFACAMVGTDQATADRRFTEIQRAFRDSGASMSFGLATLDSDDTLASVMKRGEAALTAARSARVTGD